MGADKNDRRRAGPELAPVRDPYMLISRALWHSPTISALSPPSKALLVEMHSLYNGANNGLLFLSVRDAAARLGFSDLKAAQRAFAELEALALITETIGSAFRIKADSVSRARAWRLNWINPKARKCVGPDDLPPLDFAALTPAQRRRVNARQTCLKRYAKEYVGNKTAVEESSTLDLRRDFSSSLSVEESSTPKSGNGGNPPNCSVGESSTHILPMEKGEPPETKRIDPYFHRGRFAAGSAQ